MPGGGRFRSKTIGGTFAPVGAGVLVTKDSGAAGGTAEKLQAARAEGCDVIVIARPALGNRQGFTEVDALLTALAKALERSG